MKENINIVCSTNDNFAVHCGVMLESLFQNTKYPDQIFVYLIFNKLNNINKNKILKVINKYSSNIFFKKINLNSIKIKKNYHISKETYSRIFAPDLLKKVDRFIYLDSDILVVSEIYDFFNVNLNKFSLGAVFDTSTTAEYLENFYFKEKFIFNAGVLLVDAKNFRQKKYLKKMVKFINKNFNEIKFADQDVLNIFFEGDWLKLNSKFNVQSSFFNNKISGVIFKKEYLKSIKNPSIIHFTGNRKPLDYLCINPYQKEYLKYLKQTPWKNEKMINKSFKNFFIKKFK